MTPSGNDVLREWEFSIVICTFNRAEILKDCLQSIVSNERHAELAEILVVDNNSSDGTGDVVRSFAQEYPNIRMITEKKIGLSNARNTGYREAGTGWVVYLDDDVKVAGNYIERFSFIIRKYEFDAVGGIGLPWYRFGKPRWLPDGNAAGSKIGSGHPFELKEGFLDGFNCAFRKSILEDLDGFSDELGMIGDQIGYGEETLLQIRLRKTNGRIWLDPGLVVSHLVLPHKLTLSWHLRSNYINGLQHWKTFDVKPRMTYAVFQFLLATVNFVLRAALYLPRLFRRDYFAENYFLQVTAPLLRTAGMVQACLSAKASEMGGNTTAG